MQCGQPYTMRMQYGHVYEPQTTQTTCETAADLHRENMKKKRREIDQAMDAASDLLDTDSNATFAMVFMHIFSSNNLFMFFHHRH